MDLDNMQGTNISTWMSHLRNIEIFSISSNVGTTFSKTNVTGDLSEWILPLSLKTLNLYYPFYPGLTGNISEWILPPNLEYLNIGRNNLSGDISGWIIPSSLYYLDIFLNTSLSGDITLWDLSHIKTFIISNTSMSGNLSNFVLPLALETFSIDTTQITGDVSNWVLPSTLKTFSIGGSGTALVGDVSGWTLPPNIESFAITFSLITGDISGWISGYTLPSTIRNFNCINSSLLYGDISGWTFPDSFGNIVLDGTSITADISTWIIGPHFGVWWGTDAYQFSIENNSGFTYGTGGAFTRAPNYARWFMGNCNLDSASIDRILADLVTSGAINASGSSRGIRLNGTNEDPSAAGMASRATLLTRGWTVTLTTNYSSSSSSSSSSSIP